MKIRSINSWKQNLALTKPYTIASRTISDVENIFFEITLENGMTGIGAANPAPEVVGESPDEALANLHSETVNRLVGSDIRHVLPLIGQFSGLYPKNPGTLAAIDIALHDAFGKWLGIPIVEFYGQKIKSMPTSVTIGIMSVEDTLKAAKEYKSQGFQVLKVKTGLNVDDDIERILRLREEFGTHFKIRVDANLGYGMMELQQFMNATSGAGVELIEQPLPVGEESTLLGLTGVERSRLAADESLKGLNYAWKLAQSPKPFGIYNIKLMKCGGIRGALDIASVAQHAGIDLFWGCNDESIISITAALHAAFACPHTKYIDLDGSFDLAEDVVKGGFVLQDGEMWLTGRPGLGVERI